MTLSPLSFQILVRPFRLLVLAGLMPIVIQSATAQSGIEVYLKSTMSWDHRYDSYTPTHEVLLLFPDGTAFNEMPQTPVAAFTSDAVQSTFAAEERAWYAGRWDRSGDQMMLTFDGERRVLQRRSSGWWDSEKEKPKEELEPGEGFNVYFPARAIRPDHLLGRWTSDMLMETEVMLGLTDEEEDDLTLDFHADGSFSDGATGRPLGRWQLDGLFLALDVNGQRSVRPAFVVGGDEGNRPAEVWIGDTLWRRLLD